MKELREALNELYERFGWNEVTVALSQIVDEYIIEEQKREFEKWKKQQEQKELI